MEKQKTAVLVGVQLPKVTDNEVQSSLAELGRLVHTLGYRVIGSLSQKRNGTGSALVVGEGKLKELARWSGGPGVVAPVAIRKKSKAAEKFSEDEDEPEEIKLQNQPEDTPEELADVVVFDCELSPSQMRNLESATAATVLDRTGVIIEIFSRHARTRSARLQVEIARLNYLAPRIRETGNTGDRGSGGIGGKGAGESSQELDRRNIRDRISELKQELASVQKEGALRRRRRKEENAVALVGYTNAGKSSLMRAMTGIEVLVADKLFATLETTVRPIHPATVPKILLSDTVGFIKKLPHDLVASFRSTLEEALNADLLLYVVDASDSTFREHLNVTKSVLGEIGATDSPSLLVLNKRDQLSEDQRAELAKEYPEAIQISTRDQRDLARLREILMDAFEKDMIETWITVPFDVPKLVGEIRRTMRVLEEVYDEKGARFRVRAQASDLERVQASLTGPK